MGICEIGEKKEILGKWYQKRGAKVSAVMDCGDCSGCGFNGRPCPLPATAGNIGKSIEDGGSECDKTIWVATSAPKPAPKAKWEPIGLPMRGDSITRESLKDAQDQINKLGAENARLKNQLAKLKGSK